MFLIDKAKPDGFEQLRRWLWRQPHGASKDLAEKCGVNKSRISQITRHKSRPGIDLALAIEKETGIDAALFQPILKRIRERSE